MVVLDFIGLCSGSNFTCYKMRSLARRMRGMDRKLSFEPRISRISRIRGDRIEVWIERFRCGVHRYGCGGHRYGSGGDRYAFGVDQKGCEVNQYERGGNRCGCGGNRPGFGVNR
jgi:hypothetical protein